MKGFYHLGLFTQSACGQYDIIGANVIAAVVTCFICFNLITVVPHTNPNHQQSVPNSESARPTAPQVVPNTYNPVQKL
jgi:hypothetical protein